MAPARLVLWSFLIAQVCDGLFTYAGIYARGTGIEANALLSVMMGVLGPLPALVGAKTLASCCGLFLYVRGLHRPLALLTGLYWLAAVAPWLVLLRTL